MRRLAVFSLITASLGIHVHESDKVDLKKVFCNAEDAITVTFTTIVDIGHFRQECDGTEIPVKPSTGDNEYTISWNPYRCAGYKDADDISKYDVSANITFAHVETLKIPGGVDLTAIIEPFIFTASCKFDAKYKLVSDLGVADLQKKDAGFGEFGLTFETIRTLEDFITPETSKLYSTGTMVHHIFRHTSTFPFNSYEYAITKITIKKEDSDLSVELFDSAWDTCGFEALHFFLGYDSINGNYQVSYMAFLLDMLNDTSETRYTMETTICVCPKDDADSHCAAMRQLCDTKGSLDMKPGQDTIGETNECDQVNTICPVVGFKHSAVKLGSDSWELTFKMKLKSIGNDDRRSILELGNGPLVDLGFKAGTGYNFYMNSYGCDGTEHENIGEIVTGFGDGDDVDVSIKYETDIKGEFSSGYFYITFKKEEWLSSAGYRYASFDCQLGEEVDLNFSGSMFAAADVIIYNPIMTINEPDEEDKDFCELTDQINTICPVQGYKHSTVTLGSDSWELSFQMELRSTGSDGWRNIFQIGTGGLDTIVDLGFKMGTGYNFQMNSNACGTQHKYLDGIETGFVDGDVVDVTVRYETDVVEEPSGGYFYLTFKKKEWISSMGYRYATFDCQLGEAVDLFFSADMQEAADVIIRDPVLQGF